MPTDDATETLANELRKAWRVTLLQWWELPRDQKQEWREVARFVQARVARAVTLAQREAFVDGVMWYAASIEAPGSAKEKAERLYPLPSERVPSDPPRIEPIKNLESIGYNDMRLAEKINEIADAVNALRDAQD